MSRHETHHNESVLEYLLDFRGLLPRTVEHNINTQRESISGLHTIYSWMFRKEQKAWKGIDLGDLGRKKCGK